MADFKDRLNQALAMRDMTPAELSRKTGIGEGAISQYRKGSYKASQRNLEKIALALDVPIPWLMGSTPSHIVASATVNVRSVVLTNDESNLIKKYRQLDHEGQTAVLSAIDREDRRVQALRAVTERDQRIAELETRDENKCYPFLHHLASAGTAFAFDEVPTDTIDAPFMPGADFVIGVNGNSMEPTLRNGELLYVQKSDKIHIGDIGIFTIGNEWYVKEYGANGLVSHNKKYATIPGNADIRLVGVVLGKVPE